MLILYFLGTALIIGIDQVAKLIVYNTLRFSDSVAVIDKVFNLTYCENRGAAFGILQNQIWLLAVITVVVLGAIIFFMIKTKPRDFLLVLSLTFLTGGALGNFIDRIFRGFVVDFFDFWIINFPIFNIADCFVVVGAILLTVYILFFSGESKELKR